MAPGEGCMALGSRWAPVSRPLGETEWTLVSEVLFSALALVSVTLGIEAPPPAIGVVDAVGIGVGVETVGPSPALGRVTPPGARGPQVVLYSVTAAVASKMFSPFHG